MQTSRPFALKRRRQTIDSQAYSLEASQTLPFPPTAAPAPRRGIAASPPAPRVPGALPGVPAAGGGASVGPLGCTRVLDIETTVQLGASFPVETGGEAENDVFCHLQNPLDFEDCQPVKPARRDRWRGLKQDADGFLAADRLQREAVDGCGAVYDVWLHKQCGARVGVLWRCRNRWCPDCFRSWAGAAITEIRADLAGMTAPKHLVLSIRAAGLGQLRAGWKLLDDSFRRLRRCKLWKQKARSYVQARGLTFSKGKWHVHLHIAVDADYMPHLDLKAAWIKATGGAGGAAGVQINVARDRRGLAVELLKGTKGDFKRLRQVLRGRPILWGELVLGCRGLRWYSPGGKRKAKPEKPPCCCPRCGAEFSIKQWEQTRATAEEYAAATLGVCWKDYYDGFARGAPLEMESD